ncbi:translation factor GTPase family protein [Nocardia sp. NPDC052001]|uniref:translation factor GTPase family protein n=1 Tax=Nocardia sp. NPDC052001 TaxID=3154853 RepID=UPI00342553CF
MHIRHTLNIGILAHVDAGKTSLTERLLFDTGVIDVLGAVDAGNTRTDTGAIERQRGITVRSSVVSCTADDVQVNLVDTPGHSDFIAEVDRALAVLDGAILVLSAVEGVQAQTRRLMRALREMRVPVVLFVNKIDRRGARRDELLDDIRRWLTPHLIPMTEVCDLGTRSARALAVSPAAPEFTARLSELLADTDDAWLDRLVDGPDPTAAELWTAFADSVDAGRTHPVYFGSAISGQGIDALIDGMTALLRPHPGDETADPEGIVFALERGPSGAKTAYLRLFAGTVIPRQQVIMRRRDPDGTESSYTGRITAVEVIGEPAADRLRAGGIARISGPAELRVGDRLGAEGSENSAAQHFPAPTFRTVVSSADPSAAARLHLALRQLSEQDPFIHATAAPGGGTALLLYGEIQQEIIAATLAQEFGIAAIFEPFRPAYVERPRDSGESCEEMGRRAPSPGGWWATIGLRVEPAPIGSGTAFRYETELGALPHAFHCAIEETVHATLRTGPHGRPVTDCVVTLTRSGFVGPLSTAGDFRALTPVVLARALDAAGTEIYEPCHAFEAEVPADTIAPVLSCLTELGAEIEDTVPGATGWQLIGTLPARRVRSAEQRLPGLTRGEGMWWSRPSGDRPLGAGPESRTRW